jgi:hypothetical protein
MIHKEKTTKCPSCDKELRHCHYKKHYEKCVGEPYADDVGANERICPKCDKKIVGYNRDYIKHRDRCSGSFTEYKECPKCQKKLLVGYKRHYEKCVGEPYIKPVVVKNCPKCGSEHAKEGTFCSRTCANARVHSEETKKLIGSKLIGRPTGRKGHEFGHPNKYKGIHLVDRIRIVCKGCEKEIEKKVSDPKVYCTNRCYLEDTINTRKSGNAKTGYYKGVFCGSTYELAWVVYQLDHGNPFKRFEGLLRGEEVNYCPDFLIGEKTIIEIKGWESEEEVDKKTKVAESHGYEVVVLRKEQLDKEFEWMKEKYGLPYGRFHELYDEYKPKYELVCDCCGKEITRDKKPTKDKVYCSNRCSLTENRKLRKIFHHPYR